MGILKNMKTLKEIIIEKLKIGSKSKVDANDNIGLLNEILYVLSINDKNPLQYPKDRLDFIKEEIQDWISKNHITKVKYVVDEDILDVYKTYTKQNPDIIKYFDCDEELYNKLKTKEYGKSHHIYSNDYCEIRDTENTFIIIIEEPTHQIHLRFFITKDEED